MSNAATGVIKDALKVAEADRDKVAKDTERVRAEGARAQALVDAAEERVYELTVALDMLNRPELLMDKLVDPSPLITHQHPEDFDSLTAERPEEEQLSVAGVSITRRRAE